MHGVVGVYPDVPPTSTSSVALSKEGQIASLTAYSATEISCRATEGVAGFRSASRGFLSTSVAHDIAQCIVEYAKEYSWPDYAAYFST